eukprot:m.26006 g.26006  ORF g.26006 m.26006 type:complete len:574 (+) comp9226_c0_seq2:79-1800(+)
MSFRRQLRAKVNNWTPAEELARKVTANNANPPTTTEKKKLLEAANNLVDRQVIFRVFWKRLRDCGEKWLHPYKVLLVLEYFIDNGDGQIISDILVNKFQIDLMRRFDYCDKRGKDCGIAVRGAAKRVSERLVSLVKDSGNTSMLSHEQQRGGDRETSRTSNLQTSQTSNESGNDIGAYTNANFMRRHSVQLSNNINDRPTGDVELSMDRLNIADTRDNTSSHTGSNNTNYTNITLHGGSTNIFGEVEYNEDAGDDFANFDGTEWETALGYEPEISNDVNNFRNTHQEVEEVEDVELDPYLTADVSNGSISYPVLDTDTDGTYDNAWEEEGKLNPLFSDRVGTNSGGPFATHNNNGDYDNFDEHVYYEIDDQVEEDTSHSNQQQTHSTHKQGAYDANSFGHYIDLDSDIPTTPTSSSTQPQAESGKLFVPPESMLNGMYMGVDGMEDTVSSSSMDIIKQQEMLFRLNEEKKKKREQADTMMQQQRIREEQQRRHQQMQQMQQMQGQRHQPLERRLSQKEMKDRLNQLKQNRARSAEEQLRLVMEQSKEQFVHEEQLRQREQRDLEHAIEISMRQ